ncbi:FAD-dependent monooxygenase [Pseudonocardia sp. HH130630-07]|uniref:FAD-dependent monooxygenase n=1 Tax=Pseudonocardia sp. HH130630-07 TaxID=1690815 RepID=UPI0008150D71|nr:FAD-dependent monooxygenase [Pseudonocardia sp. HH130630-07]ANY08828.1 phenol 2-monooxygenase [Pseudonocardia sp. HH130630-07]
MQFYLDGYRPGDPFVHPPHPSVADRPDGLPATTDVVVVGSGPAGLVLAAQLAAYPELRTVVVDRRDEPLAVGQADGVACRTMEMFEAFGLADRVLAEGYQVNEVTFWRPDPGDTGRIVRTGRVPDVEDGLSEMPHMIVNQARMQAFLREYLDRSAARIAPYHGLQLSGIDRADDPDEPYPVTVTLQHVHGSRPTGETSRIRARYVVGCDGSRSATRAAMGLRLEGDATDRSWGVLDVLAVTDFPDIRFKSAVTSENGSLLIIPREGGHLVRLYIELDPERDAQMLRERSADPEKLTAVANRILHPYTIDVRDVGWWAVYEIGQRLCDRFDDSAGGDARGPRVFIAGDACHTHSAKAGQGMNVSMADTWNLGWKLGAVAGGVARPEVLGTYSRERQAVARELIDFDREFTGRFSAHGGDPAEFQRFFRQQGRFTAGVAVRYATSVLTAGTAQQELATGFPAGMRLHSAPVVRVADGRRVQLGHVARADGAWRLYLFADRAAGAAPAASVSRLRTACDLLDSADSPLAPYRGAGSEPDAVVDVRAVLQAGHRSVSVADLPPVLLPRKGRFGLVDHEKVFCADPAADVFDLRGVDRDRGAAVLVRPDQYVAHVVALDALSELGPFLSEVLVARAGAGPV